MFITFDSKTLADLESRSIREVFVRFVAKGCEGTKVDVLEDFDRNGLSSELAGDLEIYFEEPDRFRLEGARITGIYTNCEEGLVSILPDAIKEPIAHMKKKWIFTSPKVMSRCGCGSSFSFEQKLVDKSKIAKLRKALGGTRVAAKPRLDGYAENCEKENPSQATS